MKKCMNHPDAFVDESLSGILAAYPGFYESGSGDIRAVIHNTGADTVKVITGGGYGHLPVFLGYVGDGLCDGVAVGNVFTSPSCETILNTARALNPKQGVLFLFGNYFGDTMNFEMAAEQLEAEGIRCAIAKVSDDLASAPRSEWTERRGIAGIALSYKIAGACARSGASLDDVMRICHRAAQNAATYGVAFSSCTLPGMDAPVFSLDDADMEVGMGIHGEPGVRRSVMLPASELAAEFCDALQKDMKLRSGERVAVLVNGLGATSREELYLFYGQILPLLQQAGITVAKALVGEFATSLEMAGLSATVLRLDGDLERLLLEPAYTPFVSY